VVQEAVGNEEAESLTILLPRVLFIEGFARLNLALSEIEGWRIEREERWRTLTRVGLRIHLGDSVWAEVLGLAPYTQYMPPTRLSPVPSLEIRTKLKGARRSKVNPRRKAAHLDALPTDAFLTAKEHRVRFKELTPSLRLRMLGAVDDKRAKARVTFTVPTVIWQALKSQL